MLRTKASTMYPLVRAETLDRVNPWVSLVNAPIATTSVGMARNTTTNAVKGATPSRLRPRSNRRNSAAGPARTSGDWGAARSGPVCVGRLFERSGLWLTVLMRWSGHRLCPVRREVRLRGVGLRVGQEDRRAGGRGQRRVQGLVDRAGGLHRVRPDRPGAALEPEVLPLVGVEELLEQPGRGRVRRV